MTDNVGSRGFLMSLAGQLHVNRCKLYANAVIPSGAVVEEAAVALGGIIGSAGAFGHRSGVPVLGF